MSSAMRASMVAARVPAVLLAAAVLVAGAGRSAAQEPGAVTVLEDATSFTLANDAVTAPILKASGDLRSLIYKGTELLEDRSGHAGGYWSHDVTGAAAIVTSVTIDPAANGGERAEVSIRGISGGIKMGHGPGAAPDGDFPADIEIRYSLGRDDPGLYTYSIFEHRPEYAAATMTEARFAVKLAEFFDWLHADELRNRHYPAPVPGEDKYVYTAIQFDNRAFGFSSTQRDIGLFIVNPSVEYLSGGPTKPEFLVHRDTTEVAAPVVLNYWRSSHYGGANVTVAAGEAWTRVIGPFLLYINEGPDPAAIWQDARARAATEAARWPYAWVEAPGFAGPAERGTVTGRLALADPLLDAFPGRLLVGLASPDYTAEMPGGRAAAISWQTDAKNYQFWVDADDPEGRFEIPDVSPGNYTLHALADGVLGEFARAGITVGAGATVDLGTLDWRPVRYGRELWSIGIPNRSGREFAGGNRFFEPDITLQYARNHPNDIDFTVGESDFSEDWFFAHVPHNTGPAAAVDPFRGVSGSGRATPYTIRFRLDEAPRGTVTLRVAISGTGTRSLAIAANGEALGEILLGPGDGVLARHQIQGLWHERAFAFDAARLAAGDNTLTLTVPAGSVTAGVVYDYLRLELDD
jgi:rhamnogalacturonan endolyase